MIRISIQVPKTPRFVISFNRDTFINLKHFISYLCAETGLNAGAAAGAAGAGSSNETSTSTATSTAANEQRTYLLMLDDAILLNLDSIQENDRLSLIPSDHLSDFVRAKDEERRQESLERMRYQ